MAEITLPSGDLSNVQIELDQNYQVNRSVWTGRKRASGLPGAQKWYASADVEGVATEFDERPWRRFLLACKGPLNWFRFPISCSQRTGSNPTVRTGATAGEALPLQGLPVSQTVLYAGQYMTVPLPSGHHRLVMLMQDLITNSSGQATASFLPALNEVPTTGAIVETIAPYLAASLTEARQGWQNRAGVTAFTLTVEENL